MKPLSRFAPYRCVTSFAATVLAIGLSGSVKAANPLELTWEKLVPPMDLELEQKAAAMQQRFSNLKDDERDIYHAVGQELAVRQRLAKESVTVAELRSDEVEILQANPVAKHPDVADFWRKVMKLQEKFEAANNAVDPAINGKRVRIPGYVLPLELDDSTVREFILVPYVGACIHTPPPPANQMVHVKAPDGFESEGLYTPVWVEGTMMAKGGASYEVKFRDGKRNIDAGYALDATKVERYGD